MRDLVPKNCSPIVKSIISLKDDSHCDVLIAPENFIWKVHNGAKTLFWEDIWVVDTPLCHLFPHLYDKCAKQHVIVRQMLVIWKTSASNDAMWSSPLDTFDLQNIANISQLIALIVLSHQEDMLCWKHTQGNFLSSKATRLLSGNSETCSIQPRIWGLIWSIKVPPKIYTFLWKLAWNRLPTNDFLSHKIAGVTAMCPWCVNEIESIPHVFWSCQVASWAWDFVGDWWSLKHIKVRSSHFSLFNLLTLKRPRHIKRVWSMVVATTLWSIWLARNDMVFNKVRIKAHNIRELIFIRSNKWGLASKTMMFGHDPLWRINPMSALNVHHNEEMTLFWKIKFEAYSVVCMVDAAWHSSSSGVLKAGIGGKIKHKSGKILYCFSAPSLAMNIHDAEIEAILHVLSILRTTKRFNHKAVICTDSTIAINAIYEGLEISFPLLIPDFDIKEMLHGSVCIQFVPSALNDEADQLAKDGVNRSSLRAYWANA